MGNCYLGQPLSMVPWENGGVKKENAEYRIQNPEARKIEFVAAGKVAGPEAGIPTGKGWKKGCWRGVGGGFWRKTVVLNYTYLHAFTRFYTKYFSLTLRALNPGQVGKICLFGEPVAARFVIRVPPFRMGGEELKVQS
jgi:hypothetical protein